MEITFPGGKRVDADYKGFTVRTDQSQRNGGEGTAPEPFDLFLASMGTCAGIYALTFCQTHDLPWQSMKLVQRTVKNPETKLIEKLEISIQVPEDFPKKYLSALVRSAELCTVKKHVSRSLPEFSISVNVQEEGEQQI